MLSNVSNKDKKKFDIALINSSIIYWYMKNDDGTYNRYLDRIDDYLEWLSGFPSEKVQYNAMKVVKEFINRYNLTDEFLRTYCFKLEHDNPKETWNRLLRK